MRLPCGAELETAAEAADTAPTLRCVAKSVDMSGEGPMNEASLAKAMSVTDRNIPDN